MTSWFVSTTRKVGDETEWRLASFDTEEEAKTYASQALARGFRVEAGTAPRDKQGRRIGWREAHAWAQSSNDGTILSLYRRVGSFAA